MITTGAENAFGIHFQLPRRLVNREDYIVRHCREKRVLHVGCVDYSSFGEWESTIDSNRWLHRKIERVATEVVGLDIAEEAVERLKTKHGVRNIYQGDAQHLERLEKGKFDVVVAGEIIEHLPCPGALLRSARSTLLDKGQLIITTTNAYCLRRLLRIPFGSESVHGDHTAYFSHRTLYRLAEISGYSVAEQCAYRLPDTSFGLPYLAERLASIVSPNLCEGLVCRLEMK